MGKHTTNLFKKTVQMAMLELKIGAEMAGGDTAQDKKEALDHLAEAVKLIGRAGDLIK